MATPEDLSMFEIDFKARGNNTDASLYVQDRFRVGDFAASLGVRFDHYSLLVSDAAISPRLAASYYFPRAALQCFASYDRIFQPPPNENLLFRQRSRRPGPRCRRGRPARSYDPGEFLRGRHTQASGERDAARNKALLAKVPQSH